MEKATVSVIRLGTRSDSYRGDVKTSRNNCSAVVLIRAQGEAIVVDSGAMGFAKEISAKLRAAGIKPGDVGFLINTHSHQDHVYNNNLFENAVLYTPTAIWRRRRGGNVVDIMPDVTVYEIPGIGLANTPGHAQKHISVFAETEEGTVCIAGDAIRESVIMSGRIPAVYSNPKEYHKSMMSILKGADIIIPGHGRTISGKRLARLRKAAARIRKA